MDPRRRREVVHEVLGSDFPGILVSDCLNIYDKATPVQHKCYAHPLKAISWAQEDCKAQTGQIQAGQVQQGQIYPGDPSAYLTALRAMLQEAKALKSV